MLVTQTPGPKATPAAPALRSQKPADDGVEVSYNAQDSVVFAPGTAIIPGVGKGGLSTARVELSKPLQPADGKYVYDEKDPRIHSALPFAAVAQTVNVWEGALGRPIQWAFDQPKLGIVPDGGNMLNAYYAREDGNVNFFHATDPKTHQKIYSGDSGEVVSHETGHAILDSLRPGYMQAWSPDPAGFHEAFGDVSAMIMSLRNDQVLDKVVEQTGGDLSKPNALAAMGEEIGIVINHTAGKNATGGDYTRNAINDFKWSDPSQLPENGGPDTLGSEAHSYSRLWSGATYDVVKGLVDNNVAGGMAPKEALRAAGDELLKIYANLFTEAPKGDFTYRDMAQAMVKADQTLNSGKNVDLLTKVFTNRNILGSVGFESADTKRRAHVEEGSASTAEGTRNIRVALNGADYGMFSGAVVESPVDKDGSLTKSAEVGGRVQDSLKKLIAAGRIKYTEPNQAVQKKDLFDSQGRPYAGVVRWQDGQMTIERVKITD